MHVSRSLYLLPLLAVLAACADDPTATPAPQPEPKGLRVLGVYDFTVTGLGTPEARAVTAPVPGGASLSLTPVNSDLTLVPVSSTSFTEGTRDQGGHRYVTATYRVRNATGAPVKNVTFIPTLTGAAIAGTPALASRLVPTGAVSLDGDEMRATDVDVLQVFEEGEVAAVPLPAGVAGLMPYGFVVRSAGSAADRTLPPATAGNDFGGVVTFAFRYPLSVSGSPNPVAISFRALAVEDTETRMTESIEEGQDTSAVRRIRERAAALGATTVTVLAGSSAASDEVADYPGQRQVCTVRTAGTADAPAGFITSEAAWTRINLLREGESPSACGAWFRGGPAVAPMPGVPHTLTVVAMDRYGNVRPVSGAVGLEHVSGPAASGGPAALANGIGSAEVTFDAFGTSLLRAAGSRVRSEQAIMVGRPSVAVVSEEYQAAMAGTAAPSAPAVVVRDAAGNPLAGRTVTFSVTAGQGSVAAATAVTGADGIARAGSWTMGASADLNLLTASVAGTGVVNSPATFRAAGCMGGGGSGYAITVCFTSGTMTVSQRAAFQVAAARWQGLVTGDVPDVPMDQPRGFCTAVSPALDMEVDDLLIFATVEPIDGPGGILGGAGFCSARATGSLPVVGRMRFDAADIAPIEAYGLFAPLIMHEMGHVLGIGTLWNPFGLLNNPSSPGSPKDTWFSGPNAVIGFNNIGGGVYTGGQKVPVENTGQVGTMNVHWRESVMANELMTGYLNLGSVPLSELTVRSLADLGYQVDPAAADPFFRTLSLEPRGATQRPGLELGNDVLTGPVQHVDEQGRVVR